VLTPVLKPSPGTVLDPGHRFARGLIITYLINERIGNTLYDLSGNQLHGTFAGGTGVPSWVAGGNGYALSFNSTNSHRINCGNSSLFDTDDTGELTLIAYIKTNALSDRHIISKGDTGDYQYTLRMDGENVQINAWVANGADHLVALSSAVVNDNKYHLIVGTIKDGVEARIYVDGVLSGSDTSSAGTWNKSGNANFLIGGRDDGAGYWPDDIGYIAAYNRVWSAEEIRELQIDPFAKFRNQRVVSGSFLAGAAINTRSIPNMVKPVRGTILNTSDYITRGLITSYPVNEGNGDKLYDLSGNNIVATFTNMDPSTDWIAGNSGYAINFPGANEFILMEDSDVFNGLGELSIECVFMLSELPSDRAERGLLVSLPRTEAPWLSFRLGVDDASDKVIFSVRNIDPALEDVLSTDSLVINTWYHVIGVYNGIDLRIYINGVLNCTPVIQDDLILDSVSTVRIGANTAFDQRLNGQIEYVNIWNRGLLAVEALQRQFDPYRMYHWPSRALFYMSSIPIYNCPLASNAAGSGSADDSMKICPSCALFDTKSLQCMFRQKLIYGQDNWRGKTLPA